MNEFDPNKFAAEVLIHATDEAAKRITESGAVNRLRRIYHSIINAYGPFLEKTYRRVSTVRTFLRPNESVDLLDAYVPVDLTDKHRDITVSEVIDRLHDGQSFVVSGLAGRGKSVLMRYIALSMYHAPRGKIPLFLELRSLNSLTSKNLLQLVHSQYKGGSSIKNADFLKALSSGYFSLILDGFDEISPADRDEIERQILKIVDDFPRCPVIVSGRTDGRFMSWERFATYHLKAMSRAQAIELIKRTNYDDGVKRTFLKRLTVDFFSKHESFLSTPLLAIMLMLTFEEYAEIPHSLHEFYRNAFDTLVRRHDAMKSQFLRQTHSGCTAEEFKRIFSSFCVLTYSKNAYSFSRDSGIEYIEAALRQQDLKFNPGLVLDDIIESICLLQEEGFLVSFVHRSFQEYFCAVFLSMAPTGLIQRYLDSDNLRVHDDVIPMLYGINPERFEDEWAREFVQGLLNKYPASDHHRSMNLFMACFPELNMTVSQSTVMIAYTDTAVYRGMMVLHRVYPAQFSFPRKTKNIDGNRWNREMLQASVELEKQGVKAFQGVEKAANRFGGVTSFAEEYKLRLDGRFEEFVRILEGEWFGNDVRGLEKVARLQRARERQGDRFIGELF